LENNLRNDGVDGGWLHKKQKITGSTPKNAKKQQPENQKNNQPKYVS